MRAVIVADVHSNLIAFTRVIVDAMSFGTVDEIWCLGDLVGYGPDPNGCVRELQECISRGITVRAVVGNHDLAAVGLLDTSGFNAHARAAAIWTEEVTFPQSVAFLGLLPTSLEWRDIAFVHGGPHDPVWDYTDSRYEAWEACRAVASRMNPARHVLVGHTHVAEYYAFADDLPEDDLDGRGARFDHDQEILLDPTMRFVVNPGSVGQPRDGDPRASYIVATVSDDPAQPVRLRARRVPYDIEEVQAQMRSFNLPLPLINRLAFGR